MATTSAVITAVLCVAGCATPVETPAVAGQDMTAGLIVTTVYPMTVLDSGNGAQLCAAVMQSYPPQCSGTSLVGWDWGQVLGHFEEATGVRWGDFVVTGTYDVASASFAPTEVIPGDGFARPEATAPVIESPCREPTEGWRVLDEARTTEATMNSAFALASRLEGFAAGWVDQSQNPATDPDVPAALTAEEQMWALNDPLRLIVNVAVTHDLEAAESALREVWGGMLCVSSAERSEAELRQIAEEISRGDHGLIANVDAVAGEVVVGVTFDDGTLQHRFDEEYGPGLVTVASVLQPVS
ncbi:hypothetical protein [Microbacterium sp. 2FI]|uniref:hypothetical protein n=1 Tax=Microbacterium sp. 2FI TaxID=2502193 RepID=UPI0010F54E2B|nr:hypothetical protein [Microbacterium sp. 2FI]